MEYFEAGVFCLITIVSGVGVVMKVTLVEYKSIRELLSAINKKEQ